MPNPRIIILTLVCAVLVVSVFYFTNRPEEIVYRAGEDPDLVAVAEERGFEEGPELILFAEREAGAEAGPTDYLVRDALNRYWEVKDSTDAVSEEVLREILKPDFSEVLPITNYTLDNIKTSPDTSQAAKDHYFHRLEEVIKGATPPTNQNFGNLENEYVVLLRYLERRDEKELEKIDPVLEGYRNMLEGMLDLEAPTDIAEEHLNFVNALNILVKNIEGLRFYSENALAGFISLGQYRNAVGNMVGSLRELVRATLS